MKRLPALLFTIVFILCLYGCYNHPTPSETTATQEITLPPETVDTPSLTSPPAAEPLSTVTAPPAEPSDQDFVRILDYIPDAVIDLRYATENNFTGQVIYDFNDPWLRYGTVKKLMKVQSKLAESGYRLKIWDAFRPTSAQFRLWEVCPDSTYVANPHNGFSSHSRGNTIDITIVYSNGTEVLMPTGFDDFSKLADRDFSDCIKEAAENAAYLEEIMAENGFSGYYGEWWHYTDTHSYPVEQNFQPANKE